MRDVEEKGGGGKGGEEALGHLVAIHSDGVCTTMTHDVNAKRARLVDALAHDERSVLAPVQQHTRLVDGRGPNEEPFAARWPRFEERRERSDGGQRREGAGCWRLQRHLTRESRMLMSKARANRAHL
jgi:hypothetical protein